LNVAILEYSIVFIISVIYSSNVKKFLEKPINEYYRLFTLIYWNIALLDQLFYLDKKNVVIFIVYYPYFDYKYMKYRYVSLRSELLKWQVFRTVQI